MSRYPFLTETGSELEEIALKKVKWTIPFIEFMTQRDSKSDSFDFAGERWHLHLFLTRGSLLKGFLQIALVKEASSTQCHVKYKIEFKDPNGGLHSGREHINTFEANVNSSGYGYSMKGQDFMMTLFRNSSRQIMTVVCYMEPVDNLTATDRPLIDLGGSSRSNLTPQSSNLSSRTCGERSTAKELGEPSKKRLKLRDSPSTAEYSPKTRLKVLARDFQDLLDKKKCCDVTLVVEEKTFEAHRTVLIARSPVFAAMFENDMTEKRTGKIDIPDCSQETFGLFLEYLYSGKFDDISCPSAVHLYRTAHKYEVPELKLLCICRMMRTLTVEDFVDTVKLADLYGEEMMFSIAEDFFVRNLNDIMLRDEWQTLMEQNSALAKKLLVTLSSKIGYRI